MTTATEDLPILLPVLQAMDWETLQQALAAAVAEHEPLVEQLEALTEEEEVYQDRLTYGRGLDERAAASVAEEVEVEYLTLTAHTEITEYIEYAFDTAPDSRLERLERLVVFAPTHFEAVLLATAFAGEGFLSDDESYREKLLSRWAKADVGIHPGKAEWLRAIGVELVRIFLSPDLGPVDRELLTQLPRLIEIGATPSGPSFADRLGQMLEEDAKKRQAEYEARKRLRREEWRKLDQLASRRRRRIRGERVEEDEDPREAEALLAASIRRWTPEMTAWALYAARVKILGVHVSQIIRNPLLSVEEKKKRIADAKRGTTIPLFAGNLPPHSRPSSEERLLAISTEYLMYSSWATRKPPVPAGPASPWPLWDNLQLVEKELHPIYNHLANLRVEFRLAEMWAEAKRGPAEQRGRVDMIDRDRATGPVPLNSAADRRLIATFQAATNIKVGYSNYDRPSKLADARATAETARHALGWWQHLDDATEKELAVSEVRYLIKAARKAQRKLAQALPGAATGNRRRKAEARLPLLKAARLRRKAEAKAHKAPVAENKPRRKKDRTA